MATPQTGIFALGTAAHAWLELDLRPGVETAAAVSLVAGLREPRTTIGGVNLVAGFRPELWAAIAPDAAPPGVAGFNEPIAGPDGYTLPATQHDVVIWLTGAGYEIEEAIHIQGRRRFFTRDPGGNRIEFLAFEAA